MKPRKQAAIFLSSLLAAALLLAGTITGSATEHPPESTPASGTDTSAPYSNSEAPPADSSSSEPADAASVSSEVDSSSTAPVEAASTAPPEQPVEGQSSPVVFTLKNPAAGNAILTDLTSWNFYSMPLITVEFNLTVQQNNVPNQKVVLTAPQGMGFAVDLGTSPGISSVVLNPDGTTATFTLNPVELMSANTITASITLKGKGVSLTDPQSLQKCINIYKRLYSQNGRPSFTLTSNYLINDASKGQNTITFSPQKFTSSAANAFNRLGVSVGVNSLDAASVISNTYNLLYMGRSLGLFLASNYTSPLTDILNSRIVLRQTPNTNTLFYEPVWDVSAKMYLPQGFTIKPTDPTLPPLNQLLFTDAEGSYVQLGGSGVPVLNAYSIITPQDSGMVMTVAKNLGITLTDPSLLLDPAFRGKQVASPKMVVSYKTVDAQGNIITGSQTILPAASGISTLKFNITPSTPVDWMKLSVYSGYQSSGFTILPHSTPDADRYISLSSNNIITETHMNETHKGGTLTFLNNGSYFINGIGLPEAIPTNTVGALTAEYYTSAQPATPVPAVISGNALVFPSQTEEDYVTKVVFTFAEGHTPVLAETYGKFTLDLTGFSNLPPNQPAGANGNYSDNTYYYSSITAVLAAQNGCIPNGEDSLYSVPPITNHAHRLTVPVRIALQEQDVLTMVTRGGARSLFGNNLQANPITQIIIMLNYDTRDAQGKYAQDPTVQTVYQNFRIDFGTSNPYQDPQLNGQDSSHLMLQRIKGGASINPFVHYTNGKIIYTTNLVPTPTTIALGDKGNPDHMTGQSGIKNFSINLAGGETLTSLIFTADKFALYPQTGSVIANTPEGPGYSAGSPQVLSGNFKDANATYWNWANPNNNSFTFSTVNTRSFPGGIPIIHNKVYHFYAEMTADNMNASEDHAPRKAIILPDTTNTRSQVIRYLLYQTLNPVAIVYNGFSDAYTQGNTFEVTLSRSAPYYSTMVDGDIWLEMRPDFIYRSNNRDMNITQVMLEGKTYLHIKEPGKTFYTSNNPIKLVLFSQVETPGSVQIFNNVWLDYTNTVLAAAELTDEPPYGIPVPGFTKYDPAPPKFREGPQYLIRSNIHGKITINKGSVSGVHTNPRAGAVLGSAEDEFLAYFRPSSAGSLAINTVVDSSDNTTNKSTEFDITYNIPNKTRLPQNGQPAIDFPLYINGLPFKTFGNSSATFKVYYISDSLNTEASLFPPEQYTEVHTVLIKVENLVDAILGFEIPLRADADTSNWNKGDTAEVDGYYYRAEAGIPTSNISTPTDVVRWKMEDIDKNSISGSVFYDLTYSGDLSGGNQKYTGRPITVNLFKESDTATPYKTQTTSTGDYSFTNLPNGRYLVGVTLPTPYNSHSGGYKFSSQIFTSNTGNNFHENGFTDPIVLEDFLHVEGINAGITYWGTMEIIMVDDESATEVTRQYIPMQTGQTLNIIANGIKGPQVNLPPETALVPNQQNFGYTPALATWDTIFISTTIKLQWDGTLYTVSFAYQDTYGNPVQLEQSQLMEPVQVRGKQNASIHITPPAGTDAEHTHYQGYSINGGPLAYASPAVLQNVLANTTITLVYKVQLPVEVIFNCTYGAYAAGGNIFTLTGKYEDDILRETDAEAIIPPTGYTFAGWAPATDSPPVSLPLTLSHSNALHGLTLYAVWQPVQTTVTYNPNGGSGTMPPGNALYNQAFTLPPCQFTRTGYSFAGWGTQPEGPAAYTNGQAFSQWKQTAPLTLYALWAVKVVPLTFDPQNGNPPEVQQLTYGQIAKKPADATKAGYVFIGWNTRSGGEGEFIAPETIHNLLEPLTLYAIYEKKSSPSSSTASSSGNYSSSNSGNQASSSASSHSSNGSGNRSSSISSSQSPSSSSSSYVPSHKNLPPYPPDYILKDNNNGSYTLRNPKGDVVEHWQKIGPDYTVYNPNGDVTGYWENAINGEWVFIPLANKQNNPHWALFNLLAAILCAILAFAGAARLLKRKNQSPAQLVFMMCTTLLGIGAVALLLLTQNFTAAMVITDSWSLLHSLLALLQIVFVMLWGKKRTKTV